MRDGENSHRSLTTQIGLALLGAGAHRCSPAPYPGYSRVCFLQCSPPTLLKACSSPHLPKPLLTRCPIPFLIQGSESKLGELAFWRNRPRFLQTSISNIVYLTGLSRRINKRKQIECPMRTSAHYMDTTVGVSAARSS